MNEALLNPAVQKFIMDNLHADVHKMMLGKSPFEGISSKELAEQIDSKKRSEKKLPTWFGQEGIYFPPKLSVEQTSSELTAGYKARLIKGKKAIDITGGFGVDSYYFSRQVESLTHVERNSALSQIAQHNLRLLGASNISFVVDDALAFLNGSEERFDTLYVDPSRRVENKKVFLLEDTEPNVVENLELFFRVADRLVIKTSPMLDIQSGLTALRGYTEELHVVSVKNDCKELLWVLSAKNTEEAQIVCSMLGSERPLEFRFKLPEERSEVVSDYASPAAYLYEPDVSVLKGGAFKTLVSRFGLKKLDVNTHLYTSEKLQEDFPGKIFQIEDSQSYKLFAREKNPGSFNVVSRNFPLSPDQLKKKYKLRDGGEDFLIFTTAVNELITIKAKRVL